jgi:hypothetical protein
MQKMKLDKEEQDILDSFFERGEWQPVAAYLLKLVAES